MALTCASFLYTPRHKIPYYKDFKDSLYKAVIVSHNFSNERLNKTLIRVNNPVFAYIKILELFNQPKEHKAGIHSSAIIAPNSKIGENVYIGPYTVIDANVEIGDFVYIGTSCHIGENSCIGKHTKIKSNVSVYDNVLIENFVIIESGSVIGTDGFGLTFHNGENHIIPHTGQVIIKNITIILRMSL